MKGTENVDSLGKRVVFRQKPVLARASWAIFINTLRAEASHRRLQAVRPTRVTCTETNVHSGRPGRALAVGADR